MNISTNTLGSFLQAKIERDSSRFEDLESNIKIGSGKSSITYDKARVRNVQITVFGFEVELGEGARAIYVNGIAKAMYAVSDFCQDDTDIYGEAVFTFFIDVDKDDFEKSNLEIDIQ